jgi:hypothetical protein
MNTHPYLRAYMAGVFIPTLVLPLLLTVFIIARLVLKLPVPIEQAIIFPMAIVPSLFGLWNIFWQLLRTRSSVSIGVHGSILPLLMAPIGAEVAHCLGLLEFGPAGVTWFHALSAPYALIAPCFLAAMAGYYLVWKYIVGSLNRVLGIA